MSKKVIKKEIKPRSELLRLPKEKLVDIILGVQPLKISLDRLDKESLGLLKKQWNVWAKVRNREFVCNVTLKTNVHVVLNDIDEFTKNFQPKDMGTYTDINTDATIKEKIKPNTILKVVNTELEKTRKVVVEVAKKAELNPKEFWYFLEVNYGSGI